MHINVNIAEFYNETFPISWRWVGWTPWGVLVLKRSHRVSFIFFIRFTIWYIHGIWFISKKFDGADEALLRYTKILYKIFLPFYFKILQKSYKGEIEPFSYRIENRVVCMSHWIKWVRIWLGNLKDTPTICKIWLKSKFLVYGDYFDTRM